MRTGRVFTLGASLAAALMGFVLRAPLAFAQSYPGGGETPPAVRGERFFRGNQGTARTGQDLLTFLLLALLALALGFVLYRLGRRKAASDD